MTPTVHPAAPAAAIEAHIAALLTDIAPGADLTRINRTGNLREELDIDSMDFLRLVQGLDARVHVAIPEADYGKVATLDDMITYVAARLR